MAAKRARGNRVGPNATVDLLREGLRQSAVHVNLGQQMIIVTEDRLQLYLRDLSDSARRRQEWHAPAGMLITELGVLVTSSFHDTVGISAQRWQSVFQTLVVLTLIWLLATVVRRRKTSSNESVIEKLKTGQSWGDQNSTSDHVSPQ